MDSALPSLNRNPDDEPLRVGADRCVRPQLLKHKTSPAVLKATRLVYQIKTKNLIGDELSPRLSSPQLGVPVKQHLGCSFVDFIDDLLRWRAE